MVEFRPRAGWHVEQQSSHLFGYLATETGTASVRVIYRPTEPGPGFNLPAVLISRGWKCPTSGHSVAVHA